MPNIENSHSLFATAPSGEAEHTLGQCGTFKHIDPADTSALKRVLSEIDSEAVWVKNESGGALTRGTIVTIDTGATYGPGRAVGAAAAAGTTVGYGVVAASSVADNDHFWCIRKGIAQIKSTTGTAVTVGAVLALGAAGRAIVYDAPGTPTAAGGRDRFGYAREAVGAEAASDTLFEAVVNFL